ncbi:hypothetical protein WL29_20480 [Burkholderia ubonensis]|uniref:Phosphoribosylanthranilate isomerase n=1 Tax=Burkholderia ubonensis TaxID=101571 RepID=A0A119HFE3_9BURK|nr:hypothetical protein [Burkholderia ubonensis]KWA83744.1 hypothetical protein WL29_20480 [Burkholderia ubonensis]
MPAQISRVSLTGLDDLTDMERLKSLSRQYPRVEWALLYVPHNEGAPRNPTRSWREAFFQQVSAGTAVHLCGALAFEQLLKGALPPDVLQADRLQLNINARKPEFTDDQVLEVYARALELGPDIILQYHPGTAALIERFAQQVPAAEQGRVHVLMDASRGTGLAPATWARPPALDAFHVGYAGGIGPENIYSVLRDVSALGRAGWIDMESGIRTNNQFDATKAETVLQAVEVFAIQGTE